MNLLNRIVIVQLGISVDYLFYHEKVKNCVATSKLVYKCIENDTSLQSACKQLCESFPEVFKNQLGCLKDVKFKSEYVHIRRRCTILSVTSSTFFYESEG